MVPIGSLAQHRDHQKAPAAHGRARSGRVGPDRPDIGDVQTARAEDGPPGWPPAPSARVGNLRRWPRPSGCTLWMAATCSNSPSKSATSPKPAPKPDRAPRDGVEHRLDVDLGAAITRRSSPVAVCCSSVSVSSTVPRLQLREEPNVLDRDDRLVGEGLQELDLLSEKGRGPRPLDRNRADRVPREPWAPKASCEGRRRLAAHSGRTRGPRGRQECGTVAPVRIARPVACPGSPASGTLAEGPRLFPGLRLSRAQSESSRRHT